MMDEELMNLELDKPGRGKTTEQLRKHTIDTQLDRKPIERSIYILTKGDEIQKLSVIQSLPTLISIDSQAAISRVIPAIQQQMPNASNELNIATSKVFGLLIELKTCPNLLASVVQGLDSKDPIVSYAWIDTLLQVIPALTDTQIKKEIIPLACRKSYLTEPVYCRIASSKILGKVAQHLGYAPMDIRKDVLPLMQSLCQDCHHEVRASVCSQLPLIAKALKDELEKTNLLTNLVELSTDSFLSVRAASVTAVANILEFLSSDMKKNTIIPLVLQIIEKAIAMTDSCSVAVSREFGRILIGLKSCLSVTEKQWFLNCYKGLASKGIGLTMNDKSSEASQDVLCRQNCAYNLPAIATFVVSDESKHIDLFYDIFKSLAADSYYLIRRTVAASMHEIVKIFGSSNKMLRVDLVRLLRDDAEEVLQTLVPNLGTIFELFCVYGTLSRTTVDQSTLDTGRALLKCQMTLANGTNWRLMTDFLSQLEHLPNCIPPDFIHQHFVHPLLNMALSGRARPVRSQATRTLLIFLKYNPREVQRKWLREVLVSQLCFSNCCYTRHIFIYLCGHAMDVFSKKYFKEHFFLPFISLADDSVSNVRLCVVRHFPMLKQMLYASSDKNLRIQLESVVSNLERHEKDVDVLCVFKQKIKEMAEVTQSEDWMSEEKRKQEEEERLVSGGVDQLTAKITDLASRRTTTYNRRNSVTSRPASVPAKPGSTPHTSDMLFLERHFYTDAGVSLPKTIANKNSSDDNNNTADEDKLEKAVKRLETTTNMTDDVKVNLRRLKGTQEGAKRHSSVIVGVVRSAAMELKRRSLNVPKDVSRIPTLINHGEREKAKVTVRKVEERKGTKSANTSIVMGEKNGKDAMSGQAVALKTQLPVPIRGFSRQPD